MKKKTIMGLPAVCIYILFAICLLGIVIGSLFDYRINMVLYNVTELGGLFEKISPIAAYALFPAGWSCILIGIKQKIRPNTAKTWIYLAIVWLGAVLISGYYYGGIIHMVMGFFIKGSYTLLVVLGWIFWVVAYILIPLILAGFLDDSNPDRLIVVGIGVCGSTIFADIAVRCLKELASRPRFRYLITLEDPFGGYRNWWEMVPNMAGEDENFQSWPSGHMAIIGVLIALPLLTDCLKKRSTRKNVIAFVLVGIYFIAAGYNRIQMAAHFLSDVCFGTMNSCLITIGVCTLLLKLFKIEENSIETRGNKSN